MSISLDATEYTFQGEGITASFFPKGAGGPIIEGVPETFFVYQDRNLSKTFGQADVSVQQIDNVGALVSVVLVKAPILGSPVTTFTVLVPSVSSRVHPRVSRPSRLPRSKQPPWCSG